MKIKSVHLIETIRDFRDLSNVTRWISAKVNGPITVRDGFVLVGDRAIPLSNVRELELEPVEDEAPAPKTSKKK